MILKVFANGKKQFYSSYRSGALYLLGSIFKIFLAGKYKNCNRVGFTLSPWVGFPVFLIKASVGINL